MWCPVIHIRMHVCTSYISYGYLVIVAAVLFSFELQHSFPKWSVSTGSAFHHVCANTWESDFSGTERKVASKSCKLRDNWNVCTDRVRTWWLLNFLKLQVRVWWLLNFDSASLDISWVINYPFVCLSVSTAACMATDTVATRKHSAWVWPLCRQLNASLHSKLARLPTRWPSASGACGTWTWVYYW